MVKNKIVALSLLLSLATSLALPSLAPGARANAAGAPVTARSSSRAAFLDAQRFLGDMGLGYYAYDHYVLKRYNAGSFKPNAENRLFTLGKAGVALSFAYDRFRAAYRRTTSGHDQKLSKLAPSLNTLLYQTNVEARRLKAGSYSDADLRSYNKMINDFRQRSKGIGYDIIDIHVAIPGA